MPLQTRYMKNLGKNCIKYVLDASTRVALKSFGAYLRSAYENNYWEPFLEIERARAKLEEMQRAQAGAERQQRKEQEQKDRAKKEEKQRKRKLVEQLQESYPVEYEELHKLASEEIGSKNIGRKTAIDLFMRNNVDDFIESHGIEL